MSKNKPDTTRSYRTALEIENECLRSQVKFYKDKVNELFTFATLYVHQNSTRRFGKRRAKEFRELMSKILLEK